MDTKNFRRILLFILLIGLVAGGALIGWYFFTTEQVTISSNSKNASVTITSLNKAEVEAKPAPLNIRMSPGTYSVIVFEGEKETRSLFKLEKGRPINLQLDLAAPKQAQNIAPYAAKNIIASDNALKFIRNPVNQLDQLQLDSGNTYVKILFKGDMSEAHWINFNQAVVADTAGKHYLFDNGQLKDLAYAINPGTVSTFAGLEALAYVSESTVYIRPSAFSEPSFSFPIPNTQPQLVLGPQKQLLIYDTDIESETTVQDFKPAIYINGTKDEKLSLILQDFIVDGARWSPNGDKLAFSAGDGLFVLDLNTANVRQLYLSYITNPQSMTWLNDNELLYFLDRKFWRVNLAESPIWTRLGSTTESLSALAPLVLSPDKKTLYFSTNTSSIDGAIHKITLEE